MDKNQLNKIKNIVEAKNMKKMMFTMEGNLCAARIREGRYRHNPPLTQEDLARKIQFLGNENTFVTPSCVCLPKRSRCRWSGLWAICRFFRSERFELLKKRRTVPVSGLPTVSVGYMKRFVCAKI